MIYYNDKKTALIKYTKDVLGMTKPVLTEAEMTALLNGTEKENYYKIYHYCGPSTEQYEQNSWYKLFPDVTISKFDTDTPSFNIYDGTSNAGTLLGTVNGLESITVSCTSGFLYFEIAKDEAGYFSEHIATDQDSIISIFGGVNNRYWCTKINCPVSIVMHTKYPTVTITSANTRFGSIFIYDGLDNEENLVATLESYPDYITEITLQCTKNVLCITLPVNEEYLWFSKYSYSENVHFGMTPEYNRLIFYITADGCAIHVETNTHYER